MRTTSAPLATACLPPAVRALASTASPCCSPTLARFAMSFCSRCYGRKRRSTDASISRRQIRSNRLDSVEFFALPVFWDYSQLNATARLLAICWGGAGFDPRTGILSREVAACGDPQGLQSVALVPSRTEEYFGCGMCNGRCSKAHGFLYGQSPILGPA